MDQSRGKYRDGQNGELFITGKCFSTVTELDFFFMTLELFTSTFRLGAVNGYS